MIAPIMRADARKCKFHASVATTLLDFVLLNYIVSHISLWFL